MHAGHVGLASLALMTGACIAVANPEYGHDDQLAAEDTPPEPPPPDDEGEGESIEASDDSESELADTDEETNAEPGPDLGKFDTLSIPDAPNLCSFNELAEPPHPYLWVANSSQGTVSKIDTVTMTEVGRYVARPDKSGSPSRISVGLDGDAAIANRNGGVTKIYADVEDCVESNGVGGIQTSTDAVFLEWGEDECIAWHTPMNYTSQRPVAWGPGEPNLTTCRWDDQEIWTSGRVQSGNFVDVIALDARDGSTIAELAIPVTVNGLHADGFGLYTGAVDGEGNFWGSQRGASGRLLKVNRSNLVYEFIATPNIAEWYGMSIDSEGMVWLCSDHVARYDPQAQEWQTAETAVGWSNSTCMAGSDGLLWQTQTGGILGVDRDTLLVERTWEIGGAYGLALDFEGYVYAVEYTGTRVTKVDPESGESWIYNGLVGAYSYSDLTGFMLWNAITAY